MLIDGGVPPFQFKRRAREAITAILGNAAGQVLPSLELQVRVYQFRLEGLSDRFLFEHLPALDATEVTVKRASRRRKQERLARTLCAFVRAIRDIGEPATWMIFNEARGYPAFDWDSDDDWGAWLRDLYDMGDVAIAEAREKHKPGPRGDRQATVLEHRIARVLAEEGVGKATSAAQRVFAAAIQAATGTVYRDAKRALARAHKSPILVIRRTAEEKARERRAVERARVRGFL